ncbi:ACSL [Acanthosepion pharaonis]|uniref:long-chain-fatty-acid--CoA ligase n=1 Tax=Acanthosepion pharaonis TaxID=158019 RepID=A0A812C6F8_ACAPH|nr:ACSL [Sepia pharaonis]
MLFIFVFSLLAEISLVICDKNSKMMNLLRRKSSMKCLRTVVCIESPNSEVVSMAEANNVKLIAFQELVPCKSTDVCIICYTSGTTGIPKGAILTHYGMVSTAMAGLQHINFLGCDDVMISYLPLAHSYERFVEILEKVNASSIKKLIFNMALTAKSNELKRGIVRNDSFWDKLVFRDIQQSLGGRTKLIATGSAPLSSNVLSFLRCVVGCVIVEGYGQTETHGVCSLQHIGDREIGEVGPPLPCCYIKLVDIPEMNYFSSENNGEGEYIAPEKIENIYIQSTFISQIFVHGDSLQRLRKDILDDLTKLGKDAGLASFEQVKALHIHPELMTVENGLLTPTMKVKRKDKRHQFFEDISFSCWNTNI